jgi:hypothetical protein
MRIVRVLAGFYKVFVDRDQHDCAPFANVKKAKANEWHAEIRNHHGDIIRYAGIWKTKADAVEEAVMVLTNMGYS